MQDARHLLPLEEDDVRFALSGDVRRQKGWFASMIMQIE
jgi:hypothetical protein